MHVSNRYSSYGLPPMHHNPTLPQKNTIDPFQRLWETIVKVFDRIMSCLFPSQEIKKAPKKIRVTHLSSKTRSRKKSKTSQWKLRSKKLNNALQKSGSILNDQINNAGQNLKIEELLLIKVFYNRANTSIAFLSAVELHETEEELNKSKDCATSLKTSLAEINLDTLPQEIRSSFQKFRQDAIALAEHYLKYQLQLAAYFWEQG